MNLTEALDLFSENLIDIKEALHSNIIDDMKALGQVAHTDDENLLEVRTEVHRLRAEAITHDRNKVIKRIVARLTPRSPVHTSITEEDIARAREMPIEEMYSGRLFKSGGKSQCGLCPFHKERTPSFHIYKDNRYKCFGCQEHGDAIELYMKTNSVKFIDAVKALTGK